MRSDERLRAWFAPANLRRRRTEIEAVSAIVYLVVGGTLVALSNDLVRAAPAMICVAALAAGIMLYRRRPFLALSLAGIATIGLFFAGSLGGVVTIPVFAPLLLVFLGAAGYGNEGTRWAALAGTLPAAVGVIGAGAYRLLAPPLGALTFGLVWSVLVLAWLGGLAVLLNRRRRAAQAGEQVATELLDLAEQQRALEQERNRVARDVHDIVAHSLAVVISQADGARYAAASAPPEVVESLEAIAATARGALTDVRVLLGELRHHQEPGPQPGIGDLRALVDGFRESGLEVRESVVGDPAPLGDAAGLAVYRIVQESLTNALRHGARGTPVELELDWGGASLAVTVANEVPAESWTAREGHGLPGMRERAALAGGELTAGLGADRRFRVRAHLPIERPALAAPGAAAP